MLSMQNKKNYSYKVYGLIIKSEINLSELMIIEENALVNYDVEICLGLIPKSIKGAKVEFENYQVSDNEMLFHINNIAKYFISEGRKIVVEPEENASSDDVKTFLLGSAFGALLIQRNMVAIHGGTMVIDGKAVVFTGDMGAGKSTITSSLRLKGYAFLADDVSVIGNTVEGFVKVNPGYPQQKLCRDAMLKLGYNLENYKRINSERDKFLLSVHDNFIKEPVPIAAIIELKVSEADRVNIVEIKGSEKFKTIYKNIYREEFIRDAGLKASYYKNLLSLIKNVQLYRITRPKDIFSVDDQVELIVRTLSEKKIAI